MNKKKCHCGRKTYAKLLCRYHYMKKRYPNYREQIIRDKPKCLITDCKYKQYAKGYCRNHHAKILRRGYAEDIPRCSMKHCKSYAAINGYCRKHNRLVEKYGVVIKDYRTASMKGSNNPRWNNGSSDYPGHATFKKNRLKVLEDCNYICVVCGGKATEIHHIDKTRDNHSIINLLPVCKMCHVVFHKGRKNKSSKYRFMYGFSLLEICAKLHLSVHKVRLLHENNVLKEQLSL